ncbi:hypothetical protein MK805_14265 [Shimazuella sp. AN120528]|uniref:hypothetical protein n=1 Tax=Shimazuella soli TaxID=1892854 RepID=UPI001F10C586|nr:hypothetical protein [Shimazuella soli]MCH5586103.1 hypothetical protein [Shimazuella soli]
MALLRRFSTTTKGAMTFTGNTLGYGELNTIYNDIGAFLTLDVSQQVPGYPLGSTLDWKKNSSMAYLNLPAGSEVLYAELIWGGSTKSSKEDVTSEINTPVTLMDSLGGSQSITPDPATAQQVTHESQVFYIRSADITDIVKNSGAGSYVVYGVPATVLHPSRSNAAGWTLAVIYKDVSLALRNMNLFVGIASIDRTGFVDQTISGFATPDSRPFAARALLTAIEGDSFIPKDQFLFGPDTSSLQVISGPNNLADNFFASQINDDNGNLDTNGTAGTNNVIPGQKQSANRYGWDITNVDVSSAMDTSQTSAIARLATKGDGFVLSGLGLQIDVNSPDIQMEKTVDKDIAVVGDILTYTILLSNNGLVEAENAIFTDKLPASVSFVPGSLQIDGIAQPTADPTRGVSVGSVSIEGPVEIVFQVEVTSVPPSGKVLNKGMLDYEFHSAPSLPVSYGSNESNEVETVVKRVQIDAVKMEDKSVYDKENEVITYTILVSNNGDVDANNILVKDAIPVGTAFVPGSIKVNGTSTTGDLTSGIPVGSLAPDQSVEITFQVSVLAPLPSQIDNQAEVSYDYQLKPDGEVISESETTNVVTAVILTECQKAQNQIFESVAQQEVALARLIQAESTKVKTAVEAFSEGRITASQLARINRSAEQVTRKIAQLENVLKEKLDIAKQICCS